MKVRYPVRLLIKHKLTTAQSSSLPQVLVMRVVMLTSGNASNCLSVVYDSFDISNVNLRIAHEYIPSDKSSHHSYLARRVWLRTYSLGYMDGKILKAGRSVSKRYRLLVVVAVRFQHFLSMKYTPLNRIQVSPRSRILW